MLTVFRKYICQSRTFHLSELDIIRQLTVRKARMDVAAQPFVSHITRKL